MQLLYIFSETSDAEYFYYSVTIIPRKGDNVEYNGEIYNVREVLLFPGRITLSKYTDVISPVHAIVTLAHNNA